MTNVLNLCNVNWYGFTQLAQDQSTFNLISIYSPISPPIYQCIKVIGKQSPVQYKTDYRYYNIIQK